ncbi:MULTISPECIES: hypothetical protein [Burkholderia]|uniref:hypothetical protein n=1 Tax=Burkholderia TaxID=32008 RepID=UPI000AF205AD|nr:MULTISPECIES: hypothetical protein [unclassified Burkholderia]
MSDQSAHGVMAMRAARGGYRQTRSARAARGGLSACRTPPTLGAFGAFDGAPANGADEQETLTDAG